MGWVGKALLFFGLVVFSYVAGGQLADTNTRVVQVVAAGAVVYFAFRSQLITGLMITVLFLPFPKGTSYGTTNMAFISLVFIVWLFRVTTGRARPAGRTPIDIPIVGLIMAYGLSFYNVAIPAHIPLAWGQFTRFLTYVFLLYMVVNIVRSTADVKKVLVAQCVSCFLVCLCALYEQSHPTAAIVPGWIDFSQSIRTGLGVRVGSTFMDYELFAEYCAINLFIQIFMFQHEKTRSRRAFVLGLMLLTFYCLLGTITRGAIVSFIAGMVYLAWLCRTRLNFIKLTTAVTLVVGIIVGGDFIVSTMTKSTSVINRLERSTLNNGMPDSRAPAWIAVWDKVLDSPIIGHGPYYSIEKGLGLEWWPHNVYLYYAYIVGFVGLFFFLWILRELWIASRPRAPSFGSGTYIETATVLIRVLLFVFMLDQVKIDYLRNGTYSFFAWFLFGLVLAVSNVARAEARAVAPVGGDLQMVPPRPQRVRQTPATAPRLAVSSHPAVPPR
jgi:O-antigen ligase